MNLLTLPTDYLIDLLSSWIEVQDLTKLDSSVVNSSVRTLFLQTISLPYFVLCKESVAHKFHNNKFGCYKWLFQRRIHSIHISFESKSSEAYLVDFFQFQQQTIRSLQLLELKDGQYDSTVCANCVNLTELSLNSNLWNVANSLPCPEKLKALHVYDFFNSKLLYAFTSVCHNIKILSLGDFFIDGVNDDTPIDLSNLVELHGEGNNNLHFGWLTKFTKKLKTIHYYSDESFDEFDLNIIAEHCTHLESVAMICGDELPIQMVESLVSINKNLKSLDVSSAGNADNVLRIMIDNCSNVRKIDMYNAYAAESMWIKFVTAFPSLVTLSLGHSVITSCFLSVLMTSCRNIEYLKMNSCVLNDDNIVTIVQTYSKLKYLFVGGCCGLTFESLDAIALHCRSLVWLEIDCQHMSFESIKRLVERCVNLKYFIVRHNEAIVSQVKLLREGLYVSCR